MNYIELVTTIIKALVSFFCFNRYITLLFKRIACYIILSLYTDIREQVVYYILTKQTS